MRFLPAALALLLGSPVLAGTPGVSRVWLTHRSPSPEKIVVNWETSEPSPSRLEYGAGEPTRQAEDLAPVLLHHLEVPMEKEAPFCYRILKDGTPGAVVHCPGYPAGDLRIAVVGDIGYAPEGWAEAVLTQKPHLLVTAGDNVPSLHPAQTAVEPGDVTAFRALIDSAPELFATTPFLPALGNHDREMRPRGPTPPAEPVYDVEATAFRSFFPLPEPGWHWTFDLPGHGLRLLAADLSHLSDQGTTWQTCHSPAPGSEQARWLAEALTSPRPPWLISLYNERNATVRGLDHGAMGHLLARSSAVITGFGYFAERAESEGTPFYNTALKGTGTVYADPSSQWRKSDDGFLLLTLPAGGPLLRVEVLNLKGAVLDRQEYQPRP